MTGVFNYRSGKRRMRLSQKRVWEGNEGIEKKKNKRKY